MERSGRKPVKLPGATKEHSLAMMVFARGVSGSGFQLSMLKRICDARKFVLCVDWAGSLLEEYVNLVLEQESAKDVVMLTGTRVQLPAADAAKDVTIRGPANYA